MDFVEQMLKDFTDAHGTSGHEKSARSVMRNYLEGTAELSHDRLGSLIAEKKGRAEHPRVMIAAHLDEVGFMVSEIDKEGYVRFLPLGGWWGHVVLGQRLNIHTRRYRFTGEGAAGMAGIEEDWLADAELLRVERVDLGTMRKTLDIPDFVMKQPAEKGRVKDGPIRP